MAFGMAIAIFGRLLQQPLDTLDPEGQGIGHELETLTGGHYWRVFGGARALADRHALVGRFLGPVGSAVAHHRSRGWVCVGTGGARHGAPAS